ncbi:hypothetical protein [Streptomyces anandii]
MIAAIAAVYLACLATLVRARTAETRYHAALFAIAAAVLSTVYWGRP